MSDISHGDGYEPDTCRVGEAWPDDGGPVMVSVEFGDADGRTFTLVFGPHAALAVAAQIVEKASGLLP